MLSYNPFLSFPSYCCYLLLFCFADVTSTTFLSYYRMLKSCVGFSDKFFFFVLFPLLCVGMCVSFRDSCKRRGEFFKSTRRQLPRTRDPSGCGVLLFPVSKSRADFKLCTEENCLKKIVKCVLSVLLLISFPFAPLVKG